MRSLVSPPPLPKAWVVSTPLPVAPSPNCHCQPVTALVEALPSDQPHEAAPEKRTVLPGLTTEVEAEIIAVGGDESESLVSSGSTVM